MIAEQVQPLKGWSTLAEVRAALGLSRQGVHDKIFKQNLFPVEDLCRIQLEHQPLYLVRTSALNAEIARRAAEDLRHPDEVHAE